MAALLSSTLVYNVKGAFDDDALNKLSYVLELAKYIKTSDNKADEDGGQLDAFLPEFLLVLRDFCLDIEVDGKEATAKDYLENCLKTKHGSLEHAEDFNEPRLRLRKYFKRRNCFPIVVPASGKRLNRLDSLKEEDLDPDFLKDISTFRDYVIQKTEPFATAAGEGINGRMFATLVVEYVEAFINGAVPCIGMTMKTMVEKENLFVVSMAFKKYDNEMERIKLPTATEGPFFEAHKSAHAAANEIFLKKCVMDKDLRAKQNLNTKINEAFSKKKEANEKLSRDGCREKIETLHKPIAKDFEEGKYFVKDGFSHYEQDIERMLQTYNACEIIGFMKDQVRFNYLQDIEKEKNAVLEKLIKKEEKQRKLAEAAQKKKEEATRIDVLSVERTERERREYQIIKEVESRFQDLKLKEDGIKEKERYETIIRYKEKEIERLRQEGKENERLLALKDMERTKDLQKSNSCIIS